jgi:hypothetical protein
LPNANRFGDLRRSTLSWCRRTSISASKAARDRKSPIKAHQINLKRSLIGSQYEPIRGRSQPFWICGRDTGNEIQLTDAMIEPARTQPFYGLEFAGRSFDCCSKVGFLAANVAYALERDDIAPSLRAELTRLLGDSG